MQTMTYAIRIGLLLFVTQVTGGWGPVQPAAVQAQQQEQADFKAQFLRLCDIAAKDLNKEFTPYSFADQDNADPETHHSPFFEDAHAVRALAVAYDMTGKKEYLDTCKHWSDRMIAYQEKMNPKGAYYLNYFRKPGKRDGRHVVRIRCQFRRDGRVRHGRALSTEGRQGAIPQFRQSVSRYGDA